MNESITLAEKEEFLYVVHGVIPEVMPTAAYRRVGHPELAGRKLIKCPYCRELLTHVDRQTLVQVFRLPIGKPKKPIPGQVFKMCASCKSEVGIVMQ